MKKDARLTIRVPRRLKDRLVGIERVYGVGLPKITNECLSAFCEYVKQTKQTPTFPILISPTHAATEGQLKLFAENSAPIHGLEWPEAERGQKNQAFALVALDVASAEDFKISKAKNIERPGLAWGRIFGRTSDYGRSAPTTA